MKGTSNAPSAKHPVTCVGCPHVQRVRSENKQYLRVPMRACGWRQATSVSVLAYEVVINVDGSVQGCLIVGG